MSDMSLPSFAEALPQYSEAPRGASAGWCASTGGAGPALHPDQEVGWRAVFSLVSQTVNEIALLPLSFISS